MSETTEIELSPGRLISDIIKAVNEQLKPLFEKHGERFTWDWTSPEANAARMPERWRWIACFAVKGGSEGYWVHIELIRQDGSSFSAQILGLMKVWNWEDALAAANAATLLLHGQSYARAVPVPA